MANSTVGIRKFKSVLKQNYCEVEKYLRGICRPWPPRQFTPERNVLTIFKEHLEIMCNAVCCTVMLKNGECYFVIKGVFEK